MRFDRLGAFCYSAEDDTPAAVMPDQVPEDVKQRRLDRLMTEQQAISLERNRLRVGSEERVLVESVGADGLGVARSAAEAPETDGVIRVGGRLGSGYRLLYHGAHHRRRYLRSDGGKAMNWPNRCVAPAGRDWSR